MSRLVLPALAAVLLVASGFAQDYSPNRGVYLKPGTKAPKLIGLQWLKGEPIKGYEKGKYYIIRFAYILGEAFSATIQTREAAEYEGKAEFILILCEKGLGAATAIRDRMTRMGDTLDNYHVALDDEKGTMQKAWLRGDRVRVNNQDFLVKGDGTVLISGHGATVWNGLAALMGKVSISLFEPNVYYEAAESAGSWSADVKAQMEQATADAINLNFEGNKAQALARLEDLETKIPQAKDSTAIKALRLHILQDPAVTYREIDKAIDQPKGQWLTMNLIDWQVSRKEGDLDMALKLCEKLRKKSRVTDSYGSYLWWKRLAMCQEFLKGNPKNVLADFQKAKRSLRTLKDYALENEWLDMRIGWLKNPKK